MVILTTVFLCKPTVGQFTITFAHSYTSNWQLGLLENNSPWNIKFQDTYPPDIIFWIHPCIVNIQTLLSASSTVALYSRHQYVFSKLPIGEMAMSWWVILVLWHIHVMKVRVQRSGIDTIKYHTRRNYLMLHQLAGATIPVANLVKLHEDVNHISVTFMLFNALLLKLSGKQFYCGENFLNILTCQPVRSSFQFHIAFKKK